MKEPGTHWYLSIVQFCLAMAFALVSVAGYAMDHNWVKGFMPNQGQIKNQFGETNSDVKFLFVSDGFNVQVNAHGFAYDMYESKNDSTFFHRVDFVFQSTWGELNWKQCDELPGKIQLVDRDTPEHTWQMPHFRRLLATDVYPFIDLELIIHEGLFKYNFLLRPGAELADIRFELKGAEAYCTAEGIRICTVLGDLIETIPLSYWAGSDLPIQIRFSEITDQSFGFVNDEIDLNFDPKGVRIIDPVPNRLWGSYWGGTALEFVYSLTEDNASNVYLCGVGTGSLSFTTAGAHQVTMAGGANEVFLLKFNSTGIIQWCTYYGGAGGETARGVTASGAGDLYLCGFTDSASGIATAGAFRTTLTGSTDGFLSKFSTAGVLLWGTYIGGTGEDYLRSVSYDLTNNLVVVAGHTKSTGQSTSGAHQTTHAGAGDAFLSQFNSMGVQQWATYMGGTAEDIANSVHMQSDGSIVIGGSTLSSGGMATPGAHQTAIGGGTDGFLAKFSVTGTRTWSTYFGGTATDNIKGVRFDYDGNAIGVGETASGTGISTVLAHQTAIGGGTDGFVAQFDPSGIRNWCSYYGGANTESVGGVAIDTTNNIYLAGSSNTLAGLATAGAYQTASSGGLDALMVQFTKSGLRNWASYYGGAGTDVCNAVVINLALQMHIAGHSTSTSGISTVGTSQVNHTAGINDDPFVVKFGDLILPIELGNVDIQCVLGRAKLVWETLSEMNTAHFEIWQSKDLNHWTLCTAISAAESSLQRLTYSAWLDCNESQDEYFQLVLVNLDGTNEVIYRGTLPCDEVVNIIIAPNPANEQLTVKGEFDLLTVCNAQGQSMTTRIVSRDKQRMVLDTTHWAAGVYILNFSIGAKNQSLRLVINH